jgi:hypothetical protein
MKGVIESKSVNIQFKENTINEINATLKDIDDIATAKGLTGTQGLLSCPLREHPRIIPRYMPE